MIVAVASTVHPRACGEHVNCAQSLSSDNGSSPRLRGTRGVGKRREFPSRFIPAPAGNTPSRKLTTAPRFGSSPRLRGTRVHRVVDVARLRFIPAPAGNTVVDKVRTSPATVHPRACGEHFSVPIIQSMLDGSSPRLRGTPIELFGIAFFNRFIPAPAGNTQNAAISTITSPVHPRACGEHHGNNRQSVRD